MSIIQKSQKALEYDKVIAEMSKFAKTEQSKQLCLDLTPYVRKTDIERELNYTSDAKAIIDFIDDIPVDKILNFSNLREKNEYFIEEELIDVAKSMRVFRLVRNFLKENLNSESQLINLVELIYTNKELEDEIFDTFDSELNVVDGATDTLKSLRNSYKDNKKH